MSKSKKDYISIRVPISLIEDIEKIAATEVRSIPKQIHFILHNEIERYKKLSPELFAESENDDKTQISFNKLQKLFKTNKNGIKQLSVLCVEDHKDHASALEALVEHFGHNPILAFTGIEAIELAQEMKFDVAIIDYHLPNNMDGKEVMIKLQELYPDIKCIVLTADTREVIRKQFETLENKPFFANKTDGAEILKNFLNEISNS